MRERFRRHLAAHAALICCFLPTMSCDTTDAAFRSDRWMPDHVADLVDIGRAAGSGQRFLDRYVDADGRVVRHDQGGDTVSEGQAYAMTVAAAIGDEATFRRVWSWTRRELLRDDGLFAWRWDEGVVVDTEFATDADLLIAGALSLAARRFQDRELGEAASATSDAILEHAVAWENDQPVLTAGPWAIDRGVINPSYLVLPVMSRLWWGGEPAWEGVADTSRRAIDQLTQHEPYLPPDWATVTFDESGRMETEATGQPPRYGWDAVRVPVQLAADCDEDGQEIAARMWPFFGSHQGSVAAVHELDGTIVEAPTHAAAMVGAAGAASAAGESESAAALLDRASAWDIAHPTYYGAAWVALGWLWLTTPLLGGCAAT